MTKLSRRRGVGAASCSGGDTRTRCSRSCLRHKFVHHIEYIETHSLSAFNFRIRSRSISRAFAVASRALVLLREFEAMVKSSEIAKRK